MDRHDHHEAQETITSQTSSLSILNPDPQRLLGPSLLHELVRDSSPHGTPAVEFQASDGTRTSVSYSELHGQADKLARRILAALPASQTSDQLVVPLLLPQCPQLYISQLATLKAGGAFCPLNLDAPPERVKFILGDVSARVIITSTALRSKIDSIESSVRVIAVDDDESQDVQSLSHEIPVEIQPAGLAYVMYTSGSTGTPKGVGISHDAVAQAFLAHDRHIPLFSRFLQFAAPTFDVSVFEIFFPLFRGATLVSCSRPDMLNDLPVILRSMQVDACELTPTVAGSLLRSRANAPELRLLLTIGEMLTEPVIKEFGGDKDRPSILWAMYGPTEATIHCTLQPSCEADSSSNNIGFPLETASAFILEPLADDGSGEFKVLPFGETGELAVGGHQTATGYINRPEQTSLVFINTPYGRLYRTGDKARMRENGTIECFGRISDGQIKLRGQRIELGEIEQAVLRTPGCRGAVAAVIQGIIVVFCDFDDPEQDSSVVLETCRDWLPAFMVPGDVLLTKGFPRLPSGKVDRKQLRSDYEKSKIIEAGSEDEYEDEVERKLAQLAEEALGVRLSPCSVLSAAGVDSLGAIKLASYLCKAGISVSAIEIMSSKTLSGLRSRIRRKNGQIDSQAEVGAKSSKLTGSKKDVEKLLRAYPSFGNQIDAIEAVVPCAPMQVAMLAETMSNPEAYCNWIEVQIPATFTIETVTSWFQDLARYNEILRTGFITLQDRFKQVIWKELDASQVRIVKRLDKRYRQDEQDLFRPFSVQILETTPRKYTRVVLQIHHALYDGWSCDILLSDLNILAQDGQLTQRPPFRLVSNYYHSIQFLHDANAARSYWAERLLGYQPIPMPQLLAKQVKSGQVFSAQRILDVDASAIRSISSQLDISLQVLFQASLLWLWGSILGSDDVVIGNITSGRTIPMQGIEDVMGPCLTTIPLRARMGQVRTIRELLESIHASARESLAHCTLPLADIKKAAGIKPGQPLYDALLVYQESVYSRAGRQQGDLVKQVAHEDYIETKLLAEVEPVERGFQFRVTYHADVFHYAYMQLFLRQFECILGHVVKQADSDVASIAGCFPDNLLSQYNRFTRTLKGCPDLAMLFEERATSMPEEPAVCFAESIDDEGAKLETVSYSELNSLANKIARHLQASGASEGDAVAIIMEKSIMLYAGILGILKAGCAYLPLLPSTPPARIQTILRQADVRLCVSDEISQGDLLEIEGCQFTSLHGAKLDVYQYDNLNIPVSPSRTANIIYTSGSTGVPKGVCVTQLNITSNLDVLSRIYPVRQTSRMLQACSQAFDVSVFEILFALTRGMCLCAATNDVLFADLERSIRAMGVTHLSMTPTVASLVSPENVPNVEFLVTSGEPMTGEVARKWMGKLYQGYGPSETTNICSVKKMTPEDHIRYLGYVFENTSAFVLSPFPESLDIMPIGCVGELCFGGDQVVVGYLNLPEVTREKFIEHPGFGRIYRSGDMGRMLANGSLLIVGRMDDQVKLRGQRIELGEINAVVAAASDVANCVTILINPQQLACFYVPMAADGGEFRVLPAKGKVARTNEGIYGTLRSRLPSYMVPSYLVPISTIPMTSSGKIDKANLRDVFGKLNPGETEALSAIKEIDDSDSDWSDDERKVTAVVAEVLNASTQDIGRWTPLTSLGLDSISAISVAKWLQTTFSRRVPISAILQNPSVARLAALVAAQPTERATQDNTLDVFRSDVVEHIKYVVGDHGLEFEKIFPCTPLQEAMLASSASDASYLNKMLFRLNVDADAMKMYWTIMFRRHGILRTCFFSTNDRQHAIAQCVLRTWEPKWLSLDATDSLLDATVSKHDEAVPPVIDSGIPPISLAVIKKGSDMYLSFVCHHALYDGVAISRLLEEIEKVAAGVELSIAPSYEPFLREMLSLPKSTDKFWKAHLATLKPKSLPRAEQGSEGRDVLTKSLGIHFSNIDQNLKALNISLLSLFQASWSTLLRIILQFDDICFGNVVNGRSGTIDRVDELVAPCFNTIPTRVNLATMRCNLDLLKSFQSLNPELIQHQFTPLRRIQALCSSKGSSSKLFDTLLLLQQPPRPLDANLWTLERDDGEMDLPLVCEVTPVPGVDRVEVKIHFDRSYVSSAFASFIHDTLSYIISTFLQFPSSHIISRESLPLRLRDRLEGLNLAHAAETSEEKSLKMRASEDWSEAEKAIRSVLSEISRVKKDKIGQHMTIFQLGLDSINAVQVSTMLRKQGFSGVTATDVLENPTCSKLAAKLSIEQQVNGDSVSYDLAGFEQTARSLLEHTMPNWEAVLPCTPLQMGMLMEFTNSKGQNYFNFVSFSVDQRIQVSALGDAWKQVVKRHTILRTGFTPLDHKDASFAMLQYAFDNDSVPLSVQGDAGFNLRAWQLEVARRAVHNLHQPPWQVALVTGEASVEMYLAIHHAIYDAHSLQIILDDLSKALRREALNGGTDIRAVVQDIIGKTRRSKDEAKEFWEMQTPGAVINKFPVMTPLREESGSILVKSKTSSLPFTALVKVVKDAGFTIQAVAQAAWSRVLSSYLGEPSVIFGVILSGRNSEATREAVFPCITTLPVTAQNFSSNRELLESMMKYNTGLQRHQRTPLTDIQRWFGHPNTRLFDTLLVYQKLDREGEQPRPWRVVDEKARVDYTVSLEIERQGGLVELRLTFLSDILPAEQAEILLGQFDAVFCDLAQRPEGKEDDLLNSCPELFAVIPAKKPELRSDVKFLHQFVELSARNDPGKTALDFVSGFENDQPVSHKWTYRELDEKGNKVASILSSHVSTGGIVAVCFDKCPEAHFAMLGILKAGCALLALDPGAPSSRKEFILQDSGAAVLLTDKARSKSLVFNVTVPVIAVDDEALEKASAAQPKLTRPLRPADRSYCLYTSGTTGTPKGCEITHENAVQAMLAFQQLFDGHWGQDSKWLQFASYHFDVSVLEQYWTWSVGITLVAAPRDVILEDLAGTISRLEITHIDLTPSLGRLLHPDDVPSLCRGVFITGGEQLKQEILDLWGPKGVIHNFYGPTEATIGVTTYPCVPINGRSSNIGWQFANVGSYVLRPGTETPVLRGGVGELCVSGKLVGKGYLNRGDLTAEKFPTIGASSERVYRTGDLVRVLHNGCFDFLGRADDQVKLRGQRLEIGEINHCIRTGVSDINDVVTLVIRNEKQQKDLLVSFVVTTRERKSKVLQVVAGDDAASISQRVQQACRDRLPGYMVPTYILQLPFIPLSPNNKAEVKELRALFNKLRPEQLVAPSSASSADYGKIGRKICKALSTMAGVSGEKLSPLTNIFELGVDSISVMQFVRALKREDIKHATPAVILRNPTVANLAQALKKSQRSTESSSGVLAARQAVEACQHRHRGSVCRILGIKPDEIDYIAPCSPLQHGMISRSRTEGNKGAYFNTFHFELAKGVSLPRLRSAWQKLVEEHSVLRTRFVSTMEGYVQVALKCLTVSWEETRLENADDIENELADRLQSWIDSNVQNINRPLEILVLGVNGKHRLVVHIFHGIYDANSFKLMVDEVSRLYQGEVDQASAPTFLNALLHGPMQKHSVSKRFWAEHLRGVNLSPMPCISKSPSDQDVSVSRRIVFEDLDKIRKTLGVTQQAIVQALWSSVLLQCLTYGVTFGIIVSGRSIELENVDRTIGPLFNTIPYHHHFTQGQTWSSAIRQCHEFNMAILPFQHVPLRDVQKWCSNGKPIFDTLFSFQRASASSASALNLWTEVESNINPDYPLAFEATLMPDSTLQILIVAQKGVADDSTLSGLLDEFEMCARAVLDESDGLVTPSSGNSMSLDPQKELNVYTRETVDHELDARRQTSSFRWTSQAETIHREMALLADVEESSIDQHTTLLELGLDSIDTIKLSARLKQAGVHLSNSELVKGQSIETYTVILHEKQTSKDEVHDSGYSSDTEDLSTSLKEFLTANSHDLSDVEQVLPPTPLQDSMVSEMIQSEFRRYFNHDVLKLSPDFDAQRLKKAWLTVIKSSPILRTAFIEIDSPQFEFAYAQLVMKDFAPAFNQIEIQSLDEISSTMEHARTRAQKGQGRSDLLQVTFAKYGQNTYMVLSIGHALYDGWSLRLLHHDIEAAYNGTYTPREPYAEYLADVVGSAKDGAKDFWSDYVSGATPTSLPPRKKKTLETRVCRAEIALSTPSSALKAFCKRHAISQLVLAQASWAAVLATHCKLLDVSFGVVLSGRETEASEAMLFPTMNTVPVRAVFYGTVPAFLRYMQDNMTGVSQFQHLPLRKILALVQDRREGLFNTLFILQKSISGDSQEDGNSEPLMTSVKGSSAVEYPVCVEMEIVGESVVWRTACDDDYLSPVATHDLLQELDKALSFLINSPDDDVLRFSEEGVAICGLPSFQPKEAASSQDILPEADSDGEVWAPTEETIRKVLAEMSGIEKASILKNHNLYHLGLDSISAIKVSSALRRQGVTVSVRDMIQATSIGDMAAKAAKSPSPSSETITMDDGSDVLGRGIKDVNVDEVLRLAGIDAADVGETLPATAMQVHMLSVWQNTRGSVFFPEFHYRLSGITDSSVIKTAWKSLIDMFPILRTRFLPTGSRTIPFVQVVLQANRRLDNPFLSLEMQPEDIGCWMVRLKIHHALYDGVSLPLIMKQFNQLVLQGQVGTVGTYGSQTYSPWKALVASSLGEATVSKRKMFWTRYLNGAKASPLTMRGTSCAECTDERVSYLERAALSDTNRFKNFCSKQGFSVQAAFLAAYAKVLASLSGRDNVVFGVYLANRGTTQQLPYPTLCLVPLRVLAGRDFQIAEVASKIQKDIHEVAAPENISVGLWDIKDWTGVVVDSFVNFLSLPGEVRGDVGRAVPDGRRDSAVQLDEPRFDEVTATAEEAASTGSDPSQMPWLEKNAVRDAYSDAVDIEVSMQPGGPMDIGVFGSRRLLGENGAEDLVQMIVDVLAM